MIRRASGRAPIDGLVPRGPGEGQAPLALDTALGEQASGKLVDASPAGPPTAPSERLLDSFDLPEAVRVGNRAAGFTHRSPIQQHDLPLALAGRHVPGQ